MTLSIVSVLINFIRVFLAPLACFFDRYHRRIVEKNLKIVFPGMDEAERARLAVKTFEQFLLNLLLSFTAVPADAIEVRGLEHLEACKNNGRGAVILLSRFGSWELMNRLGAKLKPYDLSCVYHPLPGPWLNRWFEKYRAKGGIRMLNRTTQMMEAAHRVKQGGFVGMFYDQNAGERGVWVPFFGKLASTSPLPLILKGNSRAALIPAFCYATGPGKWKVVFEPELAPGRLPGETLFRLHVCLEKRIIDHPELYLWLHNRWKTSERHIFFYPYRRGFFIPPGMRVKPFRVLVRGVNWLGDAALTIPALRALKTGRPDCHLTLMVEPALLDFWKDQYYVDRVVTVEDALKDDFDVGIVLPNSFNSAMQVYQNEVETIVGYAGEFPRRFMFLDVVVPESCRAGFKQHDVFDYLGLADFIGAMPSKTIPEYGMLRNLVQRRDSIAMHVGASYGSAKRWFEERFIELARRFPNYHWLLIGSREEWEVNRRIAAMIGENAVAADTTLSDLGKLLSTVRCLVCNDSGPMHYAAAVGTPVVAIFGSTEPALTGPLGEGHEVLREKVECSPCFRRECPIDMRCMKAVSVDAVEAAVRRVLSRT